MSVSEANLILERWPAGWSADKVRDLFKKRSPRVVILKTLWYPEIISSLEASAQDYLSNVGVPPNDIQSVQVPGSYELPLAAEWAFEGVLAGQKGPADVVVALGCVIRGETPHFDFVCEACAHGLMDVQQKSKKPLGFGVLTVDNLDQALARRSKGAEAAQAALFMHLVRSRAVDLGWLGKV